MYVKGIQGHLMTKSERRVQLITETTATTTKNSVMHNVVCKKATCCTFIAQSLYVDNCNWRKGRLWWRHTVSPEPCYYDLACQLACEETVFTNWLESEVAKEIQTSKWNSVWQWNKCRKYFLKWEYSSECKPLTNLEVNAIVALALFLGHMVTRLLLPGKQHFNIDMWWLS